MKKLIAITTFLATVCIFISCGNQQAGADEKFIYIIARPYAPINQSSNYFFSTVIQYKSDGKCSKYNASAQEFFTKAGRLFFADIAKEYNLTKKDWTLEFVGSTHRREAMPDEQGYFTTKAAADAGRTADIKKYSNKTGGKQEVIETPYTYNCN